MLGSGTISLELINSLPKLERLIVGVSGGGLLGGVALAIKHLKPSVEVIGVCAKSAPSMYNLYYNTTLPEVWETWAEALSGDVENNAITIPVIKKYVDKIVLVTEEEIENGIKLMLEQGWIAEGGGVVGIAAVLSGAIPADDTKITVIIVSGGNIDLHKVKTLIT